LICRRSRMILALGVLWICYAWWSARWDHGRDWWFRWCVVRLCLALWEGATFLGAMDFDTNVERPFQAGFYFILFYLFFYKRLLFYIKIQVVFPWVHVVCFLLKYSDGAYWLHSRWILSLCYETLWCNYDGGKT